MFDPEYIEAIILDYASNVILFLLGLFLGWIRRTVYFVNVIARKIKLKITRKKYVIIWNDHTMETSEKICAALRKENPQFLYCIVDEPRDLFYLPIGDQYVEAIIMIVTDVTKFSEIPEERKRIQERLESHFRKNGTLIGTHDIIYRRVRNEILEASFGCQLNNFKRVNEPVQAIRVESQINHPLLRNLPEEISFDDGEVCWGDWVPDATVVLETKRTFDNYKRVPLLVTRKVSFNGLVIWLNSGDKFIGIAKSISGPEQNFIRLLSNALMYNKEIKSLN